MAVAATVIHYINDVTADIMAGAPGGSGFVAADYAKHWAEAKGFGLWFQFNPHSPLTDDEFIEVHDLLGQNAPGWNPDPDAADEGYTEYLTDLGVARSILCDAYLFEEDNCANW